ncbi:CaiB/BaiF CoA transferase family protein [Amycolatopsis alkalitolerans]|uniref:CoA transferase n=1 Tax=Amycolatopsis alkalitolerans TaxID=2547244 RepID=A0A5C4M8P0_9PSEU|nr:CoA transferase [Amycolatopsis alkalitolerans]TNC29223.1 CoA transferase [Amycolatopsis alkalitolerans]
MTRPLQDVRVLDLTTVLAGPLCSMMLGDAGADVIKVEPPGGDPSRRMGPPFWGGEGAEFLALNRNKRSMVLNLKKDEDRRTFLELCESADVLVENYRTGVTARLGIGYEEISRINPRIVYCSISGFGRTGPRSDQPAYDAIMQAFTGMMASTGTPGGEPVRANVSICDIGAAMYANQAILLALAARARTGQGQYVEASMFETQIAWLLYRAVGYFATGTAPARKLGSAAPHVVPYEAFPVKDGYVIAGALNDGLFRRMMDAMCLGELGTDPRFAENPKRVANRQELKALLDRRFQEETTEYWVATFTEHGIPHSPLNSVEDVLNDPQTEARQMIVEMDHAKLGAIKMPGPAITLSGTPCRAELPPPGLGEHQAAIIDALGETGTWPARTYLDPDLLSAHGDGAHG